VRTTLESVVGATGDPRIVDRSKVLNLFEYTSIGDLEGRGVLSAFKGGLTTGGLVNLVLVGQNMPQSHVLQGWDLQTGSYRPGFPAQLEDYTLLSQPAIADVGGLPGKEVVQGTGLYLVHALDALGQEAPSFPKFTGGWNYATPAFGDLDGDGTVEMVSSTREGYLFAWSLAGPAAGNSEWWGAAHDDRSTSRHGTDTRPPAGCRTGARRHDPRPGRHRRRLYRGQAARPTVVLEWTASAASSLGDCRQRCDVAPGARVEVFAVRRGG
jgi:hypothetical protein